MVVIKGKEYLSRQEFSDATNLGYTTITNWVAKGWIEPAYVDGNRQYFTQEQVEKYWNGEYVPVKK